LADSLRGGFARDGDVLISHKGTIGRSAIVSTDDDYIMLTPQVASYRVKDASKLFNRFIRYYFMRPVFQREMIANAEGGATRAYIGITKQLMLRFRFPSLKNQRALLRDSTHSIRTPNASKGETKSPQRGLGALGDAERTEARA